MLATVHSAALQGIEAEIVLVEVNTGEAGAPDLILVGLPDAAVKESEDRVFSALSNSGFHMPRTRTTINLAPGDIRKEGPLYDLPIALGILRATGQLTADHLDGYLIAGELSLSGATRPVRGALATALLAKSLGKRGLLLPPGSAEEAALVEGIAVYSVRSLDEAYRFFTGEVTLAPLPGGVAAHHAALTTEGDTGGDFSEIKGQHALRRAVEVAVAGAHNLLMLCAIPPPMASHRISWI
jgi:magnesium chelatase family protein